MEQLILHLVGDYITQTNWMAENKVKNSFPAIVHALVYSIPFLLICSWEAFLIICITHFLIDRFKLATWLIRIKNWCWTKTGYSKELPAGLALALTMIVDNTMHLSINYFSIWYFG